MKSAIVIERGPSSYGATVPDLPGCVAVRGVSQSADPSTRCSGSFGKQSMSVWPSCAMRRSRFQNP